MNNLVCYSAIITEEKTLTNHFLFLSLSLFKNEKNLVEGHLMK
jgi:hypothetical protein